MLDEDLNPLLIEINQGPTLSIATAVTKDLVRVPTRLNDVVDSNL